MQRPSSPAEALAALQAGNERYAAGAPESIDYDRLGERIETHQPFAAVIACADSRVSLPAIFDVGEGHIFVSRVAGNSVEPGTLGSTEYAVAQLGVSLVMVLGHSDCGAVKAAIEVVDGRASFPREKFGAIGSVIEPVVGPVKALPADRRSVPEAVAANARAQAGRLAATAPIVEQAVAVGRVRVVAAVYDLGSRRVSLV